MSSPPRETPPKSSMDTPPEASSLMTWVSEKDPGTSLQSTPSEQGGVAIPSSVQGDSSASPNSDNNSGNISVASTLVDVGTLTTTQFGRATRSMQPNNSNGSTTPLSFASRVGHTPALAPTTTTTTTTTTSSNLTRSLAKVSAHTEQSSKEPLEESKESPKSSSAAQRSPRTVRSDPEDLLDESTRRSDKISIVLKPVGNAPRLRKLTFRFSGHVRIMQIVAMLRKKMGLTPDKMLYVFIKGFFAPAPDMELWHLSRCYGAGSQSLVLDYAILENWG